MQARVMKLSNEARVRHFQKGRNAGYIQREKAGKLHIFQYVTQQLASSLYYY
jgi:hypothetical protein